MTLSFSTKWPKHLKGLAGQPNYFTNKIAKSIWQNYGKEFTDFVNNRTSEENKRFDDIKPFEILSIYESEKLHPKLHTLREDSSNRWKAGMDIHYVINNRTKNRFQFAPIIPCTHTQKIFIAPNLKKVFQALPRYENEKIVAYAVGEEIDSQLLAINDGFPDVDSFFKYFDQFNGQWILPKIIHWTDLKY